MVTIPRASPALSRFPDIAKELAGGAVAAALTLPVGISIGLVTLEPLGPDIAALGVSAGVFGIILCSVLPILFGNRSPIINVPRSVTAVFVAAMLLEITGTRAAMTSASSEFLYGMVFLFLALSGAFQALIGLLRLGALVKYMPHPVLAGFMNAVAVLLALAQLPALTGMPVDAQIADMVVVPSGMHLGSLLVVAVTLAALALPQAIAVRVPPIIVALAAGTLAHHALASIGFQASLGPILGDAPALLPRLDTVMGFPALLDHEAFFPALPRVAAAAFGLAMIVSLDSLLLMKSFDRTTQQRADSQRELARLGIANTLTACIGAMPCSMSLAASQANHAAGGRGALSVLAHGVFAFGALALFGHLVAEIPRAVVAALLLSIAFNVIDRPTLATIRRLIRGNVRKRARLATDVLVMLTVASIAMLASVALAVLIGIVIAVLSFLVNMSHSVVRRVIRGDAMRSRHSRGALEMSILQPVATRIAVIELEGVIFFGTADDLLGRVEECMREGVTHVVLDLGRVTDIDTTGAQMLIQIDERVRSRGGLLVVSRASPGQPQWDFLVDAEVVASLGEQAFTSDTDRALEILENSLIDSEGGVRATGIEVPIHELPLFARLTREERDVLEPRLERRTFAQGEFVFREGDPGDDMYVIARGAASVRRAEGPRSVRLITFGEGTVFGELALLDARPRSASVQADQPLVCYVMRRAAFDELVAHNKAIALKLVMSLSQELGRRLRLANDIIDHLQL